ncbi:hypothetical protein ZWY2020_036791 [Hordeum vulgare]|nr:hypothetical protein ZWY2020_036791 [Hordeum vulgare]
MLSLVLLLHPAAAVLLHTPTGPPPRSRPTPSATVSSRSLLPPVPGAAPLSLLSSTAVKRAGDPSSLVPPLAADPQVELVSTMSDPVKDSNMQQLVPMAPPARVSGGELVARDSVGDSGRQLALVEGGGKSSGGVKLREDEEDIEVKLRRIMENVPVRASNTSGSSAGSGSGDFHQYRQMRRREQDRITRMETDYEKRKQVASSTCGGGG